MNEWTNETNWNGLTNIFPFRLLLTRINLSDTIPENGFNMHKLLYKSVLFLWECERQAFFGLHFNSSIWMRRLKKDLRILKQEKERKRRNSSSDIVLHWINIIPTSVFHPSCHLISIELGMEIKFCGKYGCQRKSTTFLLPFFVRSLCAPLSRLIRYSDGPFLCFIHKIFAILWFKRFLKSHAIDKQRRISKICLAVFSELSLTLFIKISLSFAFSHWKWFVIHRTVTCSCACFFGVFALFRRFLRCFSLVLRAQTPLNWRPVFFLWYFHWYNQCQLCARVHKEHFHKNKYFFMIKRSLSFSSRISAHFALHFYYHFHWIFVNSFCKTNLICLLFFR